MGKAIKKLIILVLIFIAAIAVIMWVNRDGEAEKTYTVMKEAGLPVIWLSYGDREINELHGYTEALEVSAVRETIYPLGDERRIPIRMETFGRSVTAVGYEVRSLDGTHLIERNETEELTETENGCLCAEIVLMDLMESGQEYLVTFVLYEGKAELARYYTRVRSQADTVVSGALEFALEFSDKTFLEKPDEMIIAQLESKSGADTSSLGYTDIYSSYSHVLWGNLHPQKSSETRIDLYEFDRLMTSLVLSYAISAVDEGGETEFYNVEEYYCVRFVNGKYYLMTYERLVGQDFSGGDEISENGRLELGVVASDELSMQIIQDGYHTIFVQNNELRCYDRETDELRTLFTFAGTETDICTEYDQHGIRVVGVEENGDVDFLVYGYMNRGVHEGDTGICYYRYVAEEDALEEVCYIPSEQNYQRINAELGTLSYMNESGLFYLMYEGSVYAIDIGGGEYVRLAADLRPDALAVDVKNGVVAWQETDENGVSSSLTIYFLDSGESRKISASKGELIKMMGFIDGDLLYGLIREEDWAKTYVYSAASPVYALEIINMDGGVENRYEQGGVYITDVEILEDRICFGRQRLVDGAWEALEDDVLFCKEESGDEESRILKSSSSDRRKLTWSLDLGLTADTLIVRNCPKLLDRTASVVNLETSSEMAGNRYLAYNNGRLEGVFYTAAEAIACIEDAMGVVVDEHQDMIWNRGNRGTAAQVTVPMTESVEAPVSEDYLRLFLHCLGTVSAESVSITEGENLFRMLQGSCERELIDLEGCTIDQILYYLSEGVPVLGIDSSNEPVLFVGYYEAYRATTLLRYDLRAADVEEFGIDEAENWFLASGNRFISAVP
ncbi:MAG: hypothetical protein IJZ85_10070 [Lachnospiraceae bacterium]|nr:hypothetical protein [Lachnospiraceae bacterium]